MLIINPTILFLLFGFLVIREYTNFGFTDILNSELLENTLLINE